MLCYVLYNQSGENGRDVGPLNEGVTEVVSDRGIAKETG